MNDEHPSHDPARTGPSEPAGSQGASTREVVSIDYIKSEQFRVIHVDGAWGGVTPQLKLQMALYSERTPIPQRITFRATPDGRLGDELERRLRADVIREVEVDAVMDLGVAIALREWLDTRIELLKQAMEQSRQEACDEHDG